MVKVDYQLVRANIRDKQNLDAIALAIFLKAKFANSCLYNHSVREIKAITHLGVERYRRTLKKGIEGGVFNRTARGVEIKRLYKYKCRSLSIRNTDSVNDIIRELRERFLICRFKRIEGVKNIINKSRGDKRLTKHEMRQYKAIRNEVTFTPSTENGSVRKSTLAKTLACSVSTINTILNGMERKRLIRKHRVLVPVAVLEGQLSLARLNEERDSWYIIRGKNCLFEQLGNFYEVVK